MLRFSMRTKARMPNRGFTNSMPPATTTATQGIAFLARSSK